MRIRSKTPTMYRSPSSRSGSGVSLHEDGVQIASCQTISISDMCLRASSGTQESVSYFCSPLKGSHYGTNKHTMLGQSPVGDRLGT